MTTRDDGAASAYRRRAKQPRDVKKPQIREEFRGHSRSEPRQARGDRTASGCSDCRHALAACSRHRDPSTRNLMDLDSRIQTVAGGVQIEVDSRGVSTALAPKLDIVT